jgi:hypothetical protein
MGLAAMTTLWIGLGSGSAPPFLWANFTNQFQS